MSYTAVVLDSSAVIAMIRGEPGAELVEPTLEAASISAISIGEVLEVLEREGELSAAARAAALSLSIEPFDRNQALISADILKAYRSEGIGIGDACCLALGISLGIPILTSDKDLADTRSSGCDHR